MPAADRFIPMGNPEEVVKYERVGKPNKGEVLVLTVEGSTKGEKHDNA